MLTCTQAQVMIDRSTDETDGLCEASFWLFNVNYGDNACVKITLAKRFVLILRLDNKFRFDEDNAHLQ
jgi:hypothetical protein